ncbi:putative arylsulfatase [Filobasidium floriforme]|uniref:putative arylsulfatase n=1 Tax=Filobasidium floriforme TaxID=5210 RepID=UPI001E8EEF90|nr:putative arylsulfatase [Filobasidium floriforme]KAH8083734.1 putative arylsulfatase [Filobasidium floriforme]
MPDQLRFDSLGHTGNPVIKTPRMDQFAREGTRFTNCFTQASVCTQSRCSMFTGQYIHTSAHRSLDFLLQAHEENMFKTLKNDGYHIAYLGPRGDTFAPGVTEMSVHEHGWIENPPNWPPAYQGKKSGISEAEKIANATIDERTFYRGILDPDEEFDYDHAVVSSAIEWLKSSPPEPFVLFMPLVYPHPPFQVAEEFYRMYQGVDLPPRIRLEQRSGHEPKYRQAIRNEHKLDRATEEDWDKIKATYYGMITRLDTQFGDIIDTLKDLDEGKMWDRTYTMMFTDHGEYLGDFGMIEKWPSGLSQQLVQEPLIIVGPGLPQGQVNESVCEMVDLLPTVFELLGVPESFPHSGKSLVPTIKEERAEHKRYAFSEGGFLVKEEPLFEWASFPYDRKAGLQHEDPALVGRAIACRDKEWTYIYRLYEDHELYDRVNDPTEIHNLAADKAYETIAMRFREAILKWMVETSDYLPWRKDPRFPKVELESTKDQIERRKQENIGLGKGDGGKFNH